MCLACQTKLDPSIMETFGERVVEIMNHSALSLMISIGYRAGLFETMKQMEHWATSEEISIAANLNERYVREWLGAMSTGRIVDVDESGSQFHLPSSHAAMLTEKGEGECLAHLAQFIPLLGNVENQILHCFKNGGGVPYSAYPRFHEVMADDSRQSVVSCLVDHILPLVPGLTMALKNGISVMDVGCGRGIALKLMAETFPQSRFVGYDLSEEAVAFARRNAAQAGLTNLVFEVKDLTNFDETSPEASFELVTAFDAIHDQARPDRVLTGIRKTLKANGTFLMQDIGASSNVAENQDHPIGPLLYTISCLHCMTVSLAQRGIGVGAMWGEQLTKEFLANAGFSNIQRHTLDHDIQNYYYVAEI